MVSGGETSRMFSNLRLALDQPAHQERFPRTFPPYKNSECVGWRVTLASPSRSVLRSSLEPLLSVTGTSMALQSAVTELLPLSPCVSVSEPCHLYSPSLARPRTFSLFFLRRQRLLPPRVMLISCSANASSRRAAPSFPAQFFSLRPWRRPSF